MFLSQVAQIATQPGFPMVGPTPPPSPAPSTPAAGNGSQIIKQCTSADAVGDTFASFLGIAWGWIDRLSLIAMAALVIILGIVIFAERARKWAVKHIATIAVWTLVVGGILSLIKSVGLTDCATIDVIKKCPPPDAFTTGVNNFLGMIWGWLDQIAIIGLFGIIIFGVFFMFNPQLRQKMLMIGGQVMAWLLLSGAGIAAIRSLFSGSC